MQCPNAETIARQTARLTHLAVSVMVWMFILIAMFKSAIAGEATGHKAAADVLAQSRTYQYQFRAGDMTVLDPWVAMLDEATRAEPQDADLWYWLGYATLAQAAKALQTGNTTDAMSAMQKGPAALREALKLNPEHAPALSQLGGIQTLLGPVLQLPAMAPRGVAQMDKAVELAPGSIRVRLMRAFAGPNVPPELRNTAHEAEDLDFLIEAAEWGTAGDYVRILRGDLYWELGQPEQARKMYRTVEGTGSGASADASARLKALQRGPIPMAEVKALRTAAGAQCAMCHAR
jgi:tetratricopeptide (TPR) repeat protein